MSSPLWPWGRVIGWEQWLALFAYSTPPPPLPYLLFTLYPTQLKIELTLACGHSTSPERNPAAMCMSASLGPASKGLELQPLFLLWFITSRTWLEKIKGRSENNDYNQSERLMYDLSCLSGLQNWHCDVCPIRCDTWVMSDYRDIYSSPVIRYKIGTLVPFFLNATYNNSKF